MKSCISSICIIFVFVGCINVGNSETCDNGDINGIKLNDFGTVIKYSMCLNGELLHEYECQKDSVPYKYLVGATSDNEVQPVENNVCVGLPDGSLINDPQACDSFFFCLFNVTLSSRCPSPLHFNPNTLDCDDPENVNCYAITTTIEPPNICDEIPDGRLLSNPESCSHFFLCLHNTAIPGICPLELYLNEIEQICDAPANVDCANPTITTTEITTTTTTTTLEDETTEVNRDRCDGLNDFTFLNDPTTCPAYFICKGGLSIPINCPNGMYFDPIFLLCVRSELVDCSDEIITTTTEVSIDNICFGQFDLVFVNDPQRCAGFIVCINEIAIPGTCPDGKYFDPILLVCDLSENVDCVPEESEEVESTTRAYSTTMGEETTLEDEEIITDQPIPDSCPSSGLIAIPNPYRCSQFIFCANGVELNMMCGPDNHFNFDKQQCVAREEANCQLSFQTCDPNASTDEFIVFVHPHDCDKFVLCLNGTHSIFSCPLGYHFDGVNVRCTSPENAQCEYV